MTVASAATSDPPPATATPPTVVDPDERGQLRIDPSVLRKIAEHTADLTPGTLRARRTVAGVGVGSAGATAKATVTGQRVDLRVELALRYPGALHRGTAAQQDQRRDTADHRLPGPIDRRDRHRPDTRTQLPRALTSPQPGRRR
jgi:hypothetical protein